MKMGVQQTTTMKEYERDFSGNCNLYVNEGIIHIPLKTHPADGGPLHFPSYLFKKRSDNIPQKYTINDNTKIKEST